MVRRSVQLVPQLAWYSAGRGTAIMEANVENLLFRFVVNAKLVGRAPIVRKMSMNARTCLNHAS